MAIDRRNEKVSDIDADAGNQAGISAPPQTQTEAFRKWFGDSKVVDANGEPMVMYHGTKEKFTEFNTAKQKNGWLGKGFYFTPNKKYAKTYGKVISAYLNISNPCIVKGEGPSDVISELREKFPEVDDFNMAEVLSRNGYDGIYFKHWEDGVMYSAFRPEQIKLATENQATFDPNNPDIRFSFVGQKAASVNNASSAKSDAVNEFQEWFGKSKVVDANGEPVMVYHGTKESFSEFKTPAWFTPNREYADFFSADWSKNGEREPSSKVISSYIRIENPIYTSDWNVTEPNAEMLEQFKLWEKQGYDGIVFNADGEIEYIVFHPSQIKTEIDLTGGNHMSDTKLNDVKEIRELYLDLVNQCLSSHPYGKTSYVAPEFGCKHIVVLRSFYIDRYDPCNGVQLDFNIICPLDEGTIYVEIELCANAERFFKKWDGFGYISINALDQTTDFAKKLLREAHKCDIPLSLSNNPIVCIDESSERMIGSEIIDEYRQELREYEKCLKAPAEYIDPLADSAKKDASMKPV